jgi:phosphoglycolate phosphatase
MIANVILDWSGTVVDDLDAVVQATNSTLQALGGAALSKEEFRRAFALPISTFYDRFLPGVPLSRIDAFYHRFFAEAQPDVPLLPGVADFCAFASAGGRRLFVLSTMSPAHFESQAEQYGLRHYFTRVYVGVKNKIETIHSLLRENHARPEETILVGDMVHDVEAAQSAGVISAAVLTGFDPVEKLAAQNPDLILRNLPALRRFLQAEVRSGSDQWIEINDLEVKGRIGVPEIERRNPQRLLVSLRFQIETPFESLDNRFEKTIDYGSVAIEVEKVVETSRAHLVETMLSEIGETLMARFPIRRLEVELRKFILPNARYVSARSSWIG